LLRESNDAAQAGHHWVCDEDLDNFDGQRVAWRAFLTPRIGPERRLCWPADELDGGAP
jgi:hypothetical protein